MKILLTLIVFLLIAIVASVYQDKYTVAIDYSRSENRNIEFSFASQFDSLKACVNFSEKVNNFYLENLSESSNNKINYLVPEQILCINNSNGEIKVLTLKDNL